MPPTPAAFLDTAAVMMHLDLVVTSDTSIAHLAGALGREVFVALRKIPDWRFLLGRDDSPWYPSMRLFRQADAGNWRAGRVRAYRAGRAGADRTPCKAICFVQSLASVISHRAYAPRLRDSVLPSPFLLTSALFGTLAGDGILLPVGTTMAPSSPVRA